LNPGAGIGVAENEFAKMLRVLSLSINNDP